MNRIQGIAVALGVALLAAGCDDDFLTTLPPDQVSSAIFWTQQKDAELAVIALYNQNQGEQLFLRLDAATDNAWAQQAFDEWYTIGQGAVDALNTRINGSWNTSYTGIRRANEVLANIDKIQVISPASLRDRLKGEAAFWRAFHYINLINLYGDVPMFLTPISIEEGEDASRTPRAQVADQILK